MRLRVLGALEVAGTAGPVPIAAPKHRALLAALAIERGRPQSADALIDALWGDAPPASAAKLLQVYVSQLRKVLPDGIRIATRPTGYVLEVDADEVDADEFERLAADGRAALAADNPALAASLLRRALDLWRGPALADVRYEEFARETIERLEGARATALADRIDADLRLGRHAEILGELRGLMAADPTDERLAARTVLAAYRTAGSGEALAILEDTRRALLDELDEAPGPELSALAAQIARGDPALAAPPREDPAPALPTGPNVLVGRERELAELRSLVARPGVRLVSLTGAGGSGKSRLALELARDLAPRFANGAVLVELASLRDPSLVLPTIARSLGLDPGADAFTVLVPALAARQLLLVVDNAEHLRSAAPDLVRLLAAAPHLVMVVTTRVVLHVSGEHVYPVGPLHEDDAIGLFAQRATALDPTFALSPDTRATVAGIVRRLDGLPLPIELAAARVRTLGLATLDARLASRLATLTGGPRDLPARQQTLRETIAWSVNLLAPGEQSVLGALAVFPSGCSLEAAVVVAGADDDILGTLVDHHLVQALDLDGERRYRLLETVREYAYELLGDRRAAVESALTDWILATIRDADFMADAGRLGGTFRLLDIELDTLRDALAHAARDADPARELALAAGVWRYWWVRGHLAEARVILDGILQRRGIVPTRSGVRTVRAAASIAWSLGDTDAAWRLAVDALAVADRIAERVEQHSLNNLLGVLANSMDDMQTSERHLLRATEIALAAGWPDYAYTATLNLGVTYLKAGRLDEARARLQEVLDYRSRAQQIEGIAFAHTNLGEVEIAAGRLAEAEAHFSAAIAGFREVGFQARLGGALQGLAAVEARTGRAEDAARRLGAAAALLGETGWGADGTSLAGGAIEAARGALGDGRFEELFREGAAEAAT